MTLGCGSAYANDRIDPARDLADSGRVQYLGFDCLAERTLALATVRRRHDPSAGHDQRLSQIVPVVATMLRRGGTVVGNFGAANVEASRDQIIDLLRAQGLQGVKVGAVYGDDVLDSVRRLDVELPELGVTAGQLGQSVMSAHAYIGAEPVAACLDGGADFVTGGRLADPSLFVAPICHELGWALDDWDKVAHATMVGHILECGVHGTGGNFEDPPYRVVADPHRLGFPMAQVDEESAVITKLPGTGGAVDERTMKTQLYYEIHDPSTYLTPDVTADFSRIHVEDLGDDRVRLSGARGRPRPDTLKVLVGVDQGFRAVGEISYAGPGCMDRARRAADLLRLHLERFADDVDDIAIGLHGWSAILGEPGEANAAPPEVRLRAALRTPSRAVADALCHEIDMLYFGPAGAGGAASHVVPAIGVTPAFVPRDVVDLHTEVVTV